MIKNLLETILNNLFEDIEEEKVNCLNHEEQSLFIDYAKLNN